MDILKTIVEYPRSLLVTYIVDIPTTVHQHPDIYYWLCCWYSAHIFALLLCRLPRVPSAQELLSCVTASCGDVCGRPLALSHKASRLRKTPISLSQWRCAVDRPPDPKEHDLPCYGLSSHLDISLTAPRHTTAEASIGTARFPLLSHLRLLINVLLFSIVESRLKVFASWKQCQK